MSQTTGREIMLLKLELVAAREQGERGALRRIVAAHPEHVAALAEFDAALVATSSYEQVMMTPESEAIAERALARAMAQVFPAQVAAAPSGRGLGARAATSLKALRKARGLSMAGLARRLGLGLDVLSDLEAGLIRAASVPDRLTRMLGELLETTAEQVQAALETQPTVRPALQRNRTPGDEAPQRDFVEAVRLSPSMTVEQKGTWLTE